MSSAKASGNCRGRNRGPAARFRRLARVAILLVLGAVLVPAVAGAASDETVPPRVLPGSDGEVKLSFAPLVRDAAPAVVNIYTRRSVQGRPSPLFADPFFRRFFGGPGGRGPGEERPLEQTALGSGVIIGRERVVVTNHHVVNQADEINVVLSDRREFEAELLVSDERTDLAVLRIKDPPADLPYLRLGDSDALEVGDLVLAIGNPFGVGQTVTSGIVSALARTQVGITDYRFFIQTDAAINPGNSGGALLDLDGRVVGINTAIYSRSGGSQGIGFAIPAAMVRAVIAGAGEDGRIVRPWLGAAGQPVTPEIAENIGLSRPAGVLVNQVYESSPAAEAGLRVGDIITRVGDNIVDDAEALRFRVATLSVGGEARLSVIRDGRVLQLAVPLRAPPEIPPRNDTTLGGATPFTGVTVSNLSPAVADELSLDLTLRGVVIADIRADSAAARIGFRRGDIIRELNGVEILNVRQLRRVVAEADRRWRLRIERGGRTLTLAFSG
ncbi:MAG: Do family serine endopeptidase [Alphaproteobacteria bacterium]